LSAVMSAPWNGLSAVPFLWGLVGGVGIIYAAVVARRLKTQTAYKPVFEDWLFHFLLPVAAYALLGVAAIAAYSNARMALFVVGAATLVFLFVGIHNAWDAITWHVFVNKGGKQKPKRNH